MTKRQKAREKDPTIPRIGGGSKGGKKRRPGPGRPPAHVQEKLKTAREQVFAARERLFQNADNAAVVLIAAMLGRLQGSDASSQERAASRLLSKVGLGDTLKVDSGPPVVVNLGDMPGHPKPDDPGLEDEALEDPDAHDDPAGA